MKEIWKMVYKYSTVYSFYQVDAFPQMANMQKHIYSATHF